MRLILILLIHLITYPLLLSIRISGVYHLVEKRVHKLIDTIEHEIIERTKPEKIHRFLIAVKQKNIDYLKKILNRVSYPSSKDYGKYLTKEEISKITIDPQSVKTIKEYLQHFNITIIEETIYHEYMICEASIEKIEHFLQTYFYEYKIKSLLDSTESLLTRAEEYSLPVELVHHIENIFMIVHFPPQTFHSSIPSLLSENMINITTTPPFEPINKTFPDLLKKVYEIPTKDDIHSIKQGVLGSLDQFLSLGDLRKFQEIFNLSSQQSISSNVPEKVLKGSCNKSPEECFEANLDVQYITSISEYSSTDYLYVDSGDIWLNWIFRVNHMENPPKVISISYSSYEISMPATYLFTFDIEAVKLGVQGITVVAASGDDGVAGRLARINPFFCYYFPSFPSTSPFILSVGGTMGPEFNRKERACEASSSHSHITSGGGFSGYFERPDYQKLAINKYFDSLEDQPILGYNRYGRGYPDISLLATNYLVVVNDNLYSIDGTSASAPVFAGMLSLINQERRKNKLASLGWIHPILYQLESLHYFDDITEGSNHCTANYPSYPLICCLEGFKAIRGWDPVSGLGSIKYKKLSKAFSHLPLLSSLTQLQIENEESSETKHTHAYELPRMNIMFWGFLIVIGTMVLLVICTNLYNYFKYRQYQVIE